MTDAGEKLRERIVNHPHYPPNDLDDTYDIVCVELERVLDIVKTDPAHAVERIERLMQ